MSLLSILYTYHTYRRQESEITTALNLHLGIIGKPIPACLCLCLCRATKTSSRVSSSNNIPKRKGKSKDDVTDVTQCFIEVTIAFTYMHHWESCVWIPQLRSIPVNLYTEGLWIPVHERLTYVIVLA